MRTIMPRLVWFRRDLRVSDNPALFSAGKNAENGVVGLFIFTPKTWQQHDISEMQINFLIENLKQLSAELQKLNIPLLIREVAEFKNIPELLVKLTKEIKINELYFNRQYEWDERQRDILVVKELKKVGCEIFSFDDQVIIPPDKILNQQNLPFKVFTPFKNKWLSVVENFNFNPLLKPKLQLNLKIQADLINKNLDKNNLNENNILITPGEIAARKQLIKFCQHKINNYQNSRDFPALDETSHLSAYLALGVLSPRQCIKVAMDSQEIFSFLDLHNKNGIGIWVSELIWREFYKMIMWHFPKVSRNQPFKSNTKKISWNQDEKLFQQWCDGLTGFPLVDAAMRQLNQTGWMHNRLRMVAAMFLTKILLIDWRWGERYFSQNLIDLDFSANNGGWQWSASTGTDAVPYFRIFNPITQSQRFDPDGDFIRKFCPELAELNAKVIHDPFAFGIKIGQINYPQKIIDYKKMRAHTLAVFKKLN